MNTERREKLNLPVAQLTSYKYIVQTFLGHRTEAGYEVRRQYVIASITNPFPQPPLGFSLKI